MAHTTLVSTDILEQNLTGGWAIVDCRADLRDNAWGLQQYRAAHIPGAVHASLHDDMAGERTGTNGRHPVPSVERLVDTFGRLGIGRGVQVVAYDQDSGIYAARLWWTLRYLGHDAVAVLDGGWAKWVHDARATKAGDQSRQPATFEPELRPEMRVGLDRVLALAGGAREALLVDARSAERFEGREEPIDRVPGHIPGALHHFYKGNLADDGTMLPADALRTRFARLLDRRSPSDVVMYCGSGVTACHNLLAMEHAGLRGAKLYPGSWSEWSSDPTRPIETGPAKSATGTAGTSHE